MKLTFTEVVMIFIFGASVAMFPAHVISGNVIGMASGAICMLTVLHFLFGRREEKEKEKE